MSGVYEEAIAANYRKDYATVLRLLRPLAERGEARAQNDLGVQYEKGHGVPQDYAEAAKWYRKAANQGRSDAMYSLGLKYKAGQGVPRDYVLAHMWFNLAAALAFPEADPQRRELEAQMTSVQIAEAQRLAREWKPTK
jgi:TPR repeat protein